MKAQIQSMMKRVKAAKGVDARKLILNELGPILLGIVEHQEATIEVTDKNFADIYATLGLGMDHANFLEHTKGVITTLSAFVDVLLVETGQFTNTDDGLQPTDTAKDEIKAMLQQQMETLTNWYEQADILLEELAVEDEEDEEGEEDEASEETMPAPQEEMKEAANA